MSDSSPVSGQVPVPPTPANPGQVPAGWPPGYPPPTSAQPTGWPPGYPAPSHAAPAAQPPPGWPEGYPYPPTGVNAPAPSAVPGRASGPVAVSVVAAEPLLGDGGLYHPPAATHIEEVKPPHPFVKLWRQMGGSSLTLSVGIHAVILVIALYVVVSERIFEKEVDFLPGGGTAQGEAASAEMRQQVQQKKRTSLNKAMPMKKIVSNSMTSEVTLPEAPPDLLDVPDVSSMLGAGGGMMGSGGFGKAGSGGGFGTGMGIGGAAGFVSLPPSMRSRCSSAERLQKLAQNGGSSECERAVSQSLEWLKTKQNDDGSWGRANKAAYTGMVLLCYLGRCETPDSPFYGDNVMKGILYLIELAQKNPHGAFTEDFAGNAGAYEHGIATYALGEMYTLARLGSKSLPGMREAFEKGVELIIKCQNGKDAGRAEGSWDYYTKNLAAGNATSKREDLSVAGWQYQALKAAKNTGLKINGLNSAIDRCVDYIERLQTKDGGIGKEKRDEHYNQYSLTGAGVLGLQTLGKANKKSTINKGIKFLRDFLTAEPLDWNKNCNLYCWYYYTQAFFQQGGDDWKFYNEQLLPQILSAQQPDGSFKPGRANWPSGDARDEIYRQALCTLQLEVYYRYLKVADRDEESFFDR